MGSFKKLVDEMMIMSLGRGFRKFTRDKDGYDRSKANLVFYTLGEFVNLYHDQIQEYFLEDSSFKEWDELKDDKCEIICLVDISVLKEHAMDATMKKKYRKAGKLRREKLQEKYHYFNPLNRIHAYVVLEKAPGKTDSKTLAMNIICASNYSDIKGVGGYTMQCLIEGAKSSGFKNIVLEVGNYDAEEHPDILEAEKEAEEEEYDSDEDSDVEEEEDVNETMIDYLSEYLWKKSVRHKNGIPYYSFGEDYLRIIISEYFYNEYSDCEEPTIVDDEEYGYGGFYFRKGVKNSQPLINYYKKYGFVEEPKVHREWKCFSSVPLPSFLLEL
jgi:hypothetical protein